MPEIRSWKSPLQARTGMCQVWTGWPRPSRLPATRALHQLQWQPYCSFQELLKMDLRKACAADPRWEEYPVQTSARARCCWAGSFWSHDGICRFSTKSDSPWPASPSTCTYIGCEMSDRLHLAWLRETASQAHSSRKFDTNFIKICRCSRKS